MSETKLVFRVHAVRRMFTRKISRDEVAAVIRNGEDVEDYPDDKPYPSKLLLGWSGGRPVHAVVAHNETEGEFIVVTAYEPDLEKWEEGFKVRRKK